MGYRIVGYGILKNDEQVNELKKHVFRKCQSWVTVNNRGDGEMGKLN